jgi:hypothetical protein
MTRCAFLTILAVLLASEVRAAETKPAAITPEQEQFFESRVRPILAEKCFKCHGSKKEMGGLRLDSSDRLRKGGDSGVTLKPGDPDNSLLIQAIRRSGEVKMPPGQPLSPEAVTALTTWVKMGAPWPSKPVSESTANAWKKHWAFQPVSNPALPSVRDQTWARTSIDRFILARLESAGLHPSPRADRQTLIRRLYFDLIGLPPSADEVAKFVADNDPDAYAKLVDRLLASPHYGERWGRYWLDIARYADTKGYVFFQESKFPWAWTYRDYVIRAFNEDLPYDRFILEQLAADRLPLGDDRRALAALGFLTVGDRFSNNPFDILDDRIDVVGRGLMGLTVSCARCHDHKFDPIPTKDYYSLYGVFASSVEPEVPPLFADPEQNLSYLEFAEELHIREAALEAYFDRKYKEVIAASKTRAAEYMLEVHRTRNQPTTEEFMLIADGRDLNPTMIIRWRAYLASTRQKHHRVFAPWHAFAAQPEKNFADEAKTVLAKFPVDDAARSLNLLVRALFAERPPASLTEVAKRYSELLNRIDERWQQLREQARAADQPLPTALPDANEEELRQVFYGHETPPNIARALFNDLALLPDRPAQDEMQKLRRAVEDWRANGPAAPPRAMVLVDARKPYDPRVFIRGNPQRMGDAVPRQFVEVLAGPTRKPFQQGSGRLELARAIADRKNPLTARVLVNRIWMQHMGTALVRTPSDFGMRSEAPTHPELLDHLATTFMEQGWSIKKLHRQMVMSATYQQVSSKPAAAVGNPQSVDPENRLYWQANRRRLDFESLRDGVLSVSGRLDRRVGGPPAGDLLANNRRTVYGFIERLNLPGLFRTFDYPNPSASTAQRDQTTVPQQALFLMNNPFMTDSARRVLARPEIAGEKDLGKKVEQLYRLLYGRPATVDEVALAREYQAVDQKAGAWDRYVQALLLANEFAFVD